jgi:biopolymer transport protein ExbB/TolQ
MFEALKQAYDDGGWPMYVNTCTLAVVLGIIVERFIVLYYRTRKLHKVHFMTQITGLIMKGEYRRAITYCDVLNTPMTRIIKSGLVAAPRSDVETQAAMDESSLRELPLLERRTGYLAMLGNVATLIGLFGTILGLIHGFGAVATADPSQKATLLARSISEAMNNTALGLGIAIPALVFFSVFQGRTQRMVDDINEAAVTVLNLVVNNRRNLKDNKDSVAAGA